MDYEKAFDFAKSVVWLLAILFWWWTILSAIRSIQRTEKVLDTWARKFVIETIKLRQGFTYSAVVPQPYDPADPNAQGKPVKFSTINQGGKGE